MENEQEVAAYPQESSSPLKLSSDDEQAHLKNVNDLFTLELIPGQPVDRVYDVLVCVLDGDMNPKDLETWANWVNLKGDDPNANWSFPVISVISKGEGLVLGLMALEHIRGASLTCQLTVGVFSPSDLGSAVALIAAYNILYRHKTGDAAMRDIYESTLHEFHDERGTSPMKDVELYMNRVMTVELRSSVAAFELKVI
eukprot:GHVH01000254.1.p1 GENE.GHVH01000254.1~~GHVH01000254.1.p1  ORF type:complete len:198 (-),score=21.41 GHVH01000254.1:19-612(-)